VQRLKSGTSIQRPLLAWLKQPRRGTGSTREQIGVPGLLADHRLQQLAHHAERKRLLKL
jgi:hypothetical protein